MSYKNKPKKFTIELNGEQIAGLRELASCWDESREEALRRIAVRGIDMELHVEHYSERPEQDLIADHIELLTGRFHQQMEAASGWPAQFVFPDTDNDAERKALKRFLADMKTATGKRLNYTFETGKHDAERRRYRRTKGSA